MPTTTTTRTKTTLSNALDNLVTNDGKKRKENRQQQRNKIELCKERKTEMRWKANKEFPFKKFDGNIARKNTSKNKQKYK